MEQEILTLKFVMMIDGSLIGLCKEGGKDIEFIRITRSG